MLSSIHPLGERGRNNRFGITAAAHLGGATLGGAVAGAVAGTLGWAIRSRLDPSDATVLGIAAVLALVALAIELVGWSLPGTARQVNEHWLTTYRGTVYGFGFGLQMGMGVVTIVTTTAVYLTLLLAALSGSVLWGAVIGATFGLARGATVLAGRRITDTERLLRFHQRLAERAATATAVARSALAGVAIAAGVLAAVS